MIRNPQGSGLLTDLMPILQTTSKSSQPGVMSLTRVGHFIDTRTWSCRPDLASGFLTERGMNDENARDDGIHVAAWRGGLGCGRGWPHQGQRESARQMGPAQAAPAAPPNQFRTSWGLETATSGGLRGTSPISAVLQREGKAQRYAVGR